MKPLPPAPISRSAIGVDRHVRPDAGCQALSDALQSRTVSEAAAPAHVRHPFPDQFVNYLQYFDWQWARSMDGVNTVFGGLRLPFTMLFTGLGVWGAIEHARRDRRQLRLHG